MNLHTRHQSFSAMPSKPCVIGPLAFVLSDMLPAMI